MGGWAEEWGTDGSSRVKSTGPCWVVRWVKRETAARTVAGKRHVGYSSERQGKKVEAQSSPRVVLTWAALGSFSLFVLSHPPTLQQIKNTMGKPSKPRGGGGASRGRGGSSRGRGSGRGAKAPSRDRYHVDQGGRPASAVDDVGRQTLESDLSSLEEDESGSGEEEEEDSDAGGFLV